MNIYEAIYDTNSYELLAINQNPDLEDQSDTLPIYLEHSGYCSWGANSANQTFSWLFDVDQLEIIKNKMLFKTSHIYSDKRLVDPFIKRYEQKTKLKEYLLKLN